MYRFFRLFVLLPLAAGAVMVSADLQESTRILDAGQHVAIPAHQVDLALAGLGAIVARNDLVAFPPQEAVDQILSSPSILEPLRKVPVGEGPQLRDELRDHSR